MRPPQPAALASKKLAAPVAVRLEETAGNAGRFVLPLEPGWQTFAWTMHEEGVRLPIPSVGGVYGNGNEEYQSNSISTFGRMALVGLRQWRDRLYFRPVTPSPGRILLLFGAYQSMGV